MLNKRSVCKYAWLGFCLAQSTWAAQVIYVDAAADGDDNGTTWCHAFSSLQDALSSVDGISEYEIRVADGTYTPTTPDGDRVTSFRLMNNVAILGGFAGCGAANPDERNPAIFESILSGDLNGDDNSGGSNAENSYQVVVGSGVDETAVLDGFTIADAFANGSNPSDRGGGLFLFPIASSPIIRHCLFRNHVTIAKGAAIYAFDAAATVSDCTFVNNQSADGGAVYNLQGGSTFSDCHFADNTATFLGGAVFNLSSAPVYRDCLFENNRALGGGGMQIASSSATIDRCEFRSNVAAGAGQPSGGAVLVQSSEPLLSNSLFVGNTAEQAGGGIHHMLGSSSTIRNCTFSFNEAGTGGGLSVGGSDAWVGNSIFWANLDNQGPSTAQLALISGSLAVLYNCVQDLPAEFEGDGNIAVDPLFVDAEGTDGQVGTDDDDFRLSESSPCIDTGQPDSVMTIPPLDLAGNDRLSCREVDMGAYEFQVSSGCLVAAVPTVSTWGMVILALLLLAAARLYIRQISEPRP
ncbi:MAG: right-handed parallel beta-helix repeat-containing protein [Planctomycetota bacterium]